MARLALRPDEIAAFRRRAAEAAMHLFAAQGYEAVTMRSLADALGVSAMTPYRYLDGGKRELFGLVRAEAFRRFADRLEVLIGEIHDAGQSRLPGDRRYANRRESLARGIPVSESALAELRHLAST